MQKWSTPDDYPERHVAHYCEESSPDRFLFFVGEAVDTRELGLPILTLEVPSSKIAKYDVLQNYSGSPVVRADLGEFLYQFAEGDIQLIPCSLQTSDEFLENYCIVNIIQLVTAIDYDRSVFSTARIDPNLITNFRKIVVSEEGIGDHHLARESRCNDLIWVSDSLREALIAKGVKGLDFMPPELIPRYGG